MSVDLHNPETYQSLSRFPSLFQTNESRRRKWSKMLGESFSNKWKKKCVSEAHYTFLVNACEIVLENQVVQLSQSKDKGGTGKDLTRMDVDHLMEAIQAADIAPHAKLSLGIVMYAMPRLYISSLFGIQPMALPLAPIFFLKKTYEDGKAPFSAGGRLDIIAQRNETYSGGRFFDEVGTGDGATTTFNLSTNGTVDHQVYFDGVLQTAVAFTITPGVTPAVDQIVFGVAPALNVVVNVSHVGYQEGDTPRRIKVALDSEDVRAEDSTLRYQTTVQAMQDLMSYHSMDMDEIMTMVLAEELLAEFEAAALLQVFKFAQAGTVNFDTAGYLAGDTSSADRKEYDRGIYKSITAANNLIYILKETNANWIVGGVDAIQKLEELMDFDHVKDGNDPMFAEIQHRVQVGILTGTGGYRVYKDARMPNDQLLLGYKGVMPFDAGFIIGPHTMYSTDLIPDPLANLQFSKGMLYRAGRVFADARQYARVKLI